MWRPNNSELDSEQPGAGMVSRKICNERIVMFRNSNGSIAAIHDRCPHRFVPLSMGKRVGDSIQCGYHGLRFDGTGACVETPHDDDNQKARACVRSYAAVERHKVIWLWMGDAEQADPELIPAFDFLDDAENYTCCQAYSHIKGNYQLIADNLLDLSHIHYLHPGIHEGSNFEDFTNKGAARWRNGVVDAVAPSLSRQRCRAAYVRAGWRCGRCDRHGNALGGVRTPYVESPLATYTGYLSAGGMGGITGAKRPFSPLVLKALYPDQAAYLKRFDRATDHLLAGRWILPEDAAAMKSAARAQAPSASPEA